MTNNEELAVPITITINYGEVAGLKGGKSREFETDQIVIFKNHVPEFEICSNSLQYPNYCGGESNLNEDEREENMLKFLHRLLDEAREEIKSRKEMREIERKKEEIRKEKEAMNQLTKYLPAKKETEEE
jgi:ubiquitin C-terminal hydrolase